MEFILGKFFGVMGCLFIGVYLMALTLILTISGGAMEADIEQELSLIVVFSVLACLLISIGYGMYQNFFNDRPFTSRAVLVAIPMFTLAFIVLSFLDPRAVDGPEWRIGAGLDMQMILGCALVMWSVLVIAALAVAISTRLTPVVNLTICSVFFILGLLSDFFFRDSLGESLSFGDAVTGFLTLAAAGLLIVGFMTLATKLFTRFLDVRVLLSMLGFGVLIALLPVKYPAVMLGRGSLILSGAGLLAALILYFVESSRFKRMLKTLVYILAFTVGVYGTLLLIVHSGAVDVSSAKIVLGKVMYRALPNLQVFWIADLLAAGKGVNIYFVLISGLYAFFHVTAYLFLAVMLFRERQLA